MRAIAVWAVLLVLPCVEIVVLPIGMNAVLRVVRLEGLEPFVRILARVAISARLNPYAPQGAERFPERVGVAMARILILLALAVPRVLPVHQAPTV